MKCTGCRKEDGRIAEVHGEFQPLVAGQKLPKASALHAAVLYCHRPSPVPDMPSDYTEQ